MRRWPVKSSSETLHLPVMVNQVVDLVGECPDGVVVDGTVGAGGHLEALNRAHGNRFRYFGFDLDNIILQRTREVFAGREIEAEFINANYKKIAWHLKRRGITSISAVLLDLGIGSFQIDDPSRGFSYLQDGPLSMSFDNPDSLAAAKVIAMMSEKELRELFYTYGEEPKARQIAHAIKQAKGPVDTTEKLAEIIRSVVGGKLFVKTAARVFQALRIKVNEEFDNLSKGLDRLLPIVAPGGRALVITYHSLEDHLVKKYFKKYTGKCICPPKTPECRCGKVKLFRQAKPILPEKDEIAVNLRARSAKLRVMERIEEAA